MTITSKMAVAILRGRLVPQPRPPVERDDSVRTQFVDHLPDLAVVVAAICYDFLDRILDLSNETGKRGRVGDGIVRQLGGDDDALASMPRWSFRQPT